MWRLRDIEWTASDFSDATVLEGHGRDTPGVSFLNMDDSAARVAAPSLLFLRIGVA